MSDWRETMTLQSYFATSRQARYSVLFAFPLLILYEGLSALLSGSAVAGVRNGADVLLKTVFLSLGGRWESEEGPGRTDDGTERIARWALGRRASDEGGGVSDQGIL